MALRHVQKDVSSDVVAEALRTEGYVIVDELASQELMNRIAEEMAPHVALSPFCRDHIAGKRTQRTGAMIARSPAARELLMNPLALAATERLLEKSSTFQLGSAQIISVHPGSPAQELHQDQGGFDLFPFPNDYHIQLPRFRGSDGRHPRTREPQCHQRAHAQARVEEVARYPPAIKSVSGSRHQSGRAGTAEDVGNRSQAGKTPAAIRRWSRKETSSRGSRSHAAHERQRIRGATALTRRHSMEST